jgi:hypothetical protein
MNRKAEARLRTPKGRQLAFMMPRPRYAFFVSLLRKFVRNKRRREAADVFARRAELFQSECGWCGKFVGDDEPVMAVGGRVREGIDLSQVEGKVIELRFEAADRTVLAGVAGFDSDAKAEGKDIIFMTCSEECGRLVQAAFEEELTHGFRIQ